MREIPLTQFERDLYGIEHLWVEDELRHHTTPGKDGCEQMTDHISTEEAERIAESLDFDCKCHRCASSAQQIGADALRSLAAERDALREDLRWIESVAGEPSEPHYGQALSAVRDRAHFALGENQP